MNIKSIAVQLAISLAAIALVARVPMVSKIVTGS
jgi:hypothetical protein